MGATRSIGTTLTKTSGTHLPVLGLTKISEFGVEGSELDVTDLNSPNNFKEYIPGFLDGGEVSCEGFIKDESNFSAMVALAVAGTTQNWETLAPDGAKWFFQGFVKMWKEAEASVEGIRGFTGSIRITGMPIYASTGISA